MEIRFQNLGPESWHAQAALVLCHEGENLAEKYPDLDKACPWLAVAPAARDFKGQNGQTAIFHGHPDLKLPRVLAAGLGKAEETTLDDIRMAMGRLARMCRDLELESALLPASMLEMLPFGRDRLLEECVYAFSCGLYIFDKLKTKQKDKSTGPAWLALGFKTKDDGAEAAARRGEADALAMTIARNLDNMPGNMLYPEALASHAMELSQKYSFSCQILDVEKLNELGAGCLLAVGQGSCHPPRLVVAEYAPKGHEQDKPLVLVGKGLTFDSGGICIKPAANMGQMKCDMSGAGAVLATVATASASALPHRVVGVLACAENMPDGRACRPGDVLTALSGETVEVINTDAEGRLALADALVYAQKQWTPAAIIDIATLTGACAVALGAGLAGLFCDDDGLAQRIAAQGKAGGENFWRLPLWKPYEENLKSEIADIKHTGPREGGAITAALFLKNFVGRGQLWAHLDIAGVDWNAKNTPLCPEGASGFGVRSLLALARGGLA